jgi:hypothetical protein
MPSDHLDSFQAALYGVSRFPGWASDVANMPVELNCCVPPGAPNTMGTIEPVAPQSCTGVELVSCVTTALQSVVPPRRDFLVIGRGFNDFEGDLRDLADLRDFGVLEDFADFAGFGDLRDFLMGCLGDFGDFADFADFGDFLRAGELAGFRAGLGRGLDFADFADLGLDPGVTARGLKRCSDGMRVTGISSSRRHRHTGK